MKNLALNLDFETRNGVAILTLAHSPVNAIGRELREELSTAFKDAAQDPHVTAVVLAGRGPHFSVGADVAEFGGSAYGQAQRNGHIDGLSLASLCS